MNGVSIGFDWIGAIGLISQIAILIAQFIIKEKKGG